MYIDIAFAVGLDVMRPMIGGATASLPSDLLMEAPCCGIVQQD